MFMYMFACVYVKALVLNTGIIKLMLALFQEKVISRQCSSEINQFWAKAVL